MIDYLFILFFEKWNIGHFSLSLLFTYPEHLRTQMTWGKWGYRSPLEASSKSHVHNGCP
jgi:hypothetical protein